MFQGVDVFAFDVVSHWVGGPIPKGNLDLSLHVALPISDLSLMVIMENDCGSKGSAAT